VIDRLTTWANARTAIRAMIMTSSRVRPGGPLDALSDYDIILAVADAEQFVRDAAWKHDYGQPMVRWGDQSQLFGFKTYFRGVVCSEEPVAG
jgi:hypothetical protein